MMAKIDVDHSGTVDLMEFSNITSLIWKDHDPSDDLVLCWKVFGMNKQENRNYIKHWFLDPTSKGALSIKNLKKDILNNNEAGITESELEDMFAIYNDEDQITVTEFINAVCKTEIDNKFNLSLSFSV